MKWSLGHELVQPDDCKELHFPLQTSHRQLRNTEMHSLHVFWRKTILSCCCPSSPRLGELPTSTAMAVPHSCHAMYPHSCARLTEKKEHLPKPWFKMPHAWLEKPFSSWLAQSPWYCSQDREICRGSATRHLFNFGFAFWIESLGLTSHRGFPNGILIASQFSFWQTQTYLSLNLMSTTCFIRGRKIVTKIKIKNSAMGNTFKCKEVVWQGKKGVSWGLVSLAIPHY